MGWISCTSVVFVLEAFLFILYLFSVVFCFRLVYLSLCSYNRQTHIYKQNTQQHKKLREKHTAKHKPDQQKYIISQPEPERLNRGRVLGWISCMCVLMLLFSKLFCCLLRCLFVFMFSPSLFQLLHLQSKQTHINTEQQQSIYNNWMSLYKVFPFWMLSPARGYMFNVCKLHDYNHTSLTMHRNPLLWKGTPYCTRKSLTPLLYR